MLFFIPRTQYTGLHYITGYDLWCRMSPHGCEIFSDLTQWNNDGIKSRHLLRSADASGKGKSTL